MLEEWSRLAVFKESTEICVLNVNRLAVDSQLKLYGDGIIDFDSFATLNDMDI